MLTTYAQWCYQKFGDYAKDYARRNPDFVALLRKARFDTIPEVYIAEMRMTFIIVMIVSIVVAIILFFITGIILNSLLLQLVVIASIVATLIIAVYVGFKKGPAFRASSRARKINTYLPYAVNFTAAMAAANATPQKIFRSLAIQENIYSEISRDAGRIYRDITVLGKDLITALKTAVARSPSPRYAEFLQGIVSTLQSGGSLKSYFTNKAEAYMRENRKDQEMFLETLAVMAESYVVVAVAFPVFGMVIGMIMYWISGAGVQISEGCCAGVIVGLLPILHIMYVGIIKMLTPEI